MHCSRTCYENWSGDNGVPQYGLSTGGDLNPEPSSYAATVLYGLSVLRICAKAVVAHFNVLERQYSGETASGMAVTCLSTIRQLARSVV